MNKKELRFEYGFNKGKTVYDFADSHYIKWAHDNMFIGEDRQLVRDILSEREDCFVTGTIIAIHEDDINALKEHDYHSGKECEVTVYMEASVKEDGTCLAGVIQLKFNELKHYYSKKQHNYSLPLFKGKPKRIKGRYVTVKAKAIMFEDKPTYDVIEITNISPKTDYTPRPFFVPGTVDHYDNLDKNLR